MDTLLNLNEILNREHLMKMFIMFNSRKAFIFKALPVLEKHSSF